MNRVIDWMEKGYLPDGLIRWGIRRLNRRRLAMESAAAADVGADPQRAFREMLRASPLVVHADKANQQHYELPPGFFQRVLGARLKYSGCYWPEGVGDLDTAEEEALRLVCERAQIADG